MISNADIIALLIAFTGIVAAIKALRETRSADVRMIVEALQRRVTELESGRDAMQRRIDQLEDENTRLKVELHAAQERLRTLEAPDGRGRRL